MLPTDPKPKMDVAQALQVLVDLRSDGQIVVTNQGSSREWPKLCPPETQPLDFHYIPSTMSGAVPLALGLALAQPQRHVLAITGDGSLLMSLGCLVTVVASGAANLTVVLLDNGCYEITGGQKTAASRSPVDFAGLARAAGFTSVNDFTCLNDWRQQATSVLKAPGPRFIRLAVEPVRENYRLDPPCPIAEQVARLRAALTSGVNQ